MIRWAMLTGMLASSSTRLRSPHRLVAKPDAIPDGGRGPVSKPRLIQIKDGARLTCRLGLPWAAFLSRARQHVAGYLRQPHHMRGMNRDARVDQMLKSARATAEVARRPDDAKLLLILASDYELLAQCALTITETQRRLATSRRIIDHWRQHH